MSRVCENFLYVFKAARRAARAAATAAFASAPARAPAAAGQTPVGCRDKPSPCGPRPAEKFQGRCGFDKGTLAAAQIGLTRAGPKGIPIASQSVRAAAPCQIRRSVRAELAVRCRRPPADTLFDGQRRCLASL